MQNAFYYIINYRYSPLIFLSCIMFFPSTTAYACSTIATVRITMRALTTCSDNIGIIKQNDFCKCFIIRFYKNSLLFL